MIPAAGVAVLPDAPIEVRLQKLADILAEFDAAGPKQSVLAERLAAGGSAYVFNWNQPADEYDPVDGDPSETKIVEIAIAFLKDKLPKELLPAASNLLVLGKYDTSASKTRSKWVWIAEFRVDDQSPFAAFAATGYPQTLFVPVSVKGAILLDVQKVPIEHGLLNAR